MTKARSATKAVVASAKAMPAPLANKISSARATKSVKATPPATSVPDVKLKHKLVRDSFTIPKDEYLVLQGLKERAADLKRPIKKSELLRAGVAVLSGLADGPFLKALAVVISLKTGRPKAEPADGRGKE